MGIITRITCLFALLLVVAGCTELGCPERCMRGGACVDGRCQCPEETRDCGYLSEPVCAVVSQDPEHCGACGHRCPVGHACTDGVCDPCPTGEAACGDSPAGPVCTDITSDPAHCGDCDVQCPAGITCIEGECRLDCGTELTWCPDALACADLAGDVLHCGECGHACGPHTLCLESACTCDDVNLTLCPDGCFDLQTHPGHCGDCETRCQGADICIDGHCGCPEGLSGCGDSCLDLQTDPQNCGECDHVCGPEQTCTDGQCACSDALAVCGPDCVDLQFDAANCQQCDLACQAGRTCSMAACVSPTSLSAGPNHTCVRLDDARVSCFGDNTQGQLGRPPSPAERPYDAGLVNVGLLALGLRHSCAVLADQTVVCWGGNNSGQLGDGSRTARATPAPVTGLAEVVELAAGHTHTCVRTPTAVRCWGIGTAGQLGDGAPATATSPIDVVVADDLTHIALGPAATCIWTASAGFTCYGFPRTTPELFTEAGEIVHLAFGESHHCGLASTGAVWCLGENTRGQLGQDNGATSIIDQAVQVEGIDSAQALGCGADHCCTLLADGRVMCWGANDAGQLGNGTTGADSPVPVEVQLSIGATALSVGGQHACALGSDQIVRCWGNGESFQLGGLEPLPQPTPTEVRW